MEQFPPLGSELGGGVPLPASSDIIFLYDGFTTSFNTPEGEHRHPTLFRYVEFVPRMSSSRRAGFPALMSDERLGGLVEAVVTMELFALDDGVHGGVRTGRKHHPPVR